MNRKLLLPLCVAVLFSFAVKGQVANFTVSLNPVCPNTAVSFDGTSSTGNNLTYSWAISGSPTDYIVGSLTNPTLSPVIFINSGTYTVTLTVKDGVSGLTDTKSMNITVNPAPVADFNTIDTVGCAPLISHFFDNSTAGGPGASITSYSWFFGNSVTSNAKNPVDTFNLPGSFAVSLQVQNNFGCVGIASLKTVSGNINVTPGVTPSFNETFSSSCKPPTTAFFTSTTTGPGTLTYDWDFGDGQPHSFVQNPPHVYNSGGNFTVILKATSDQGCSATYSNGIFISTGSVSSTFSAPDTICINTPVQFQNTSSPNPNTVLWRFGDGNTSTNPSNPINTYISAGTFPVTLINHFASCDDSVTKNIVVQAQPVIDFTAALTNSCKAPFTVNFQNLSTNASQYIWDFGDGTPNSNLVNPSHTYSSYGQFTVKLIASNAGGCGYTIFKTNFIQVVKPSVRITNLPGNGCAPYTFSPTVVDTVVDGIASWFWDFGNGFTFNGANPPPQTYAAGVFPVKVTITTTGGCTASYVDTVHVGTIKPTADFTASPLSACVNGKIFFQDNSTGGANAWLWDFGNGATSSLRNPVYGYPAPGTYTVKLTAFNNGCDDIKTIANYITVSPPLSKFGYTYNCSNTGQYSFHDSSVGPITTWSWAFGDGSTSSSPSPAHTYAAAGNYVVRLIVTNGGCSDTSSQQIVVGGKPDFAFFPSAMVCKNTNVNVNSITNANVVNWTWDFGDGTIVGPLSPSWAHIYPTPGSYLVKLTTVDKLGCADSIIHTLTVSAPVANFSAPVTQACNNLNATFTDLSTGTVAIVTRNWDFGDGVTGTGATPSHNYTTQGIFPVKLKVTDASGCTDSLTKPNYIVLSIPTALFSSADSMSCPAALVKFTNTSPPPGGFNPVYTWDFGDGTNFTGANPPPHNYPIVNLTKYTVKLSVLDSYGCTASYTKPNFILIDTPNASFALSDTFASCPPLFEKFKYLGHYAQSVFWNFGPTEGASNIIGDVNHLYAIPGTYNPSLTVTSPGGCSVMTSQKIQVNGPIGNFTYAPLGGCDTLTVFFNANVGPGVTGFVWYFNLGSDSASTLAPFVSYKYYKAGTYIPIMKLTDTANCSVFYKGANAIVVDSVKAKFVTDKSTICEDGTIQFTDTSYKSTGTIITSYFWDFGDGTTLSGMNPNPAHQFTSSGLFPVKMIVYTQFGCSDSVINQMKVVANPQIDISGVVSQCVPAVLNFGGVVLVPDTSVLTWNWDFNNGQTSTIQNPLPQTYPKAGHYVIQLKATNSTGCYDSASADLFVYPLPIVFAGADTTICLGQSVLLQPTGNSISYTWLPPSNSSLSCSNCQNTLATPTITTSYFVQGTSALGCNAIDTVVVTVNQPVTVSVSPPDSVCIGQSVQISASGAALYVWSPASGLSNANVANPLATPLTTTNYQVIGSDNKYCFFDTGYVNITVFNYPTVNVGPDVTINVGSSYQITGAGSPDIVSLTWLPVTGLSCSDCLSPLATPVNTTNYSLTAINNGNCAASDSIKITVICNNANFFVPNTFSPNGDGVNDVFYVRGKGLNIIPSLTIFNRWGQIVFQRRDFAANDPSAGWDGTINGQKAPVDVYVYTLDIICDNSSLIPYHGNIALIR